MGHQDFKGQSELLAVAKQITAPSNAAIGQIYCHAYLFVTSKYMFLPVKDTHSGALYVEYPL